ncbi:hypothetical protein [Parashewanella tropica]|uniref:hypothetical protein n=1 Tax=Parashewanella tropica TaxID=2547970 RepID=UPI00105A7AEB|nr:hypothetical protein [Parashewanella tropica]
MAYWTTATSRVPTDFSGSQPRKVGIEPTKFVELIKKSGLSVRDLTPHFGLDEGDEQEIMGSAPNDVPAQRFAFARKVAANPKFNIVEIQKVFKGLGYNGVAEYITEKRKLNLDYFSQVDTYSHEHSPTQFAQVYESGEQHSTINELQQQVKKLTSQLEKSKQKQQQQQTQINELKTTLEHTNSEIERRVERKVAEQIARKEEGYQHQIASLTSQLERVKQENLQLKLSGVHITASQATPEVELVVPSGCNQKIDSDKKARNLLSALMGVTELWEDFGCFLTPNGFTTGEIKQGSPHAGATTHLMALIRAAKSRTGKEKFTLQKVIDSLNAIRTPKHAENIQRAMDRLLGLQQKWNRAEQSGYNSDSDSD